MRGGAVKRDRLVPEFQKRARVPRAGFVPGDEYTVETWQVWCRNAESGDERRATHGDMRRAGFARRKR